MSGVTRLRLLAFLWMVGALACRRTNAASAINRPEPVCQGTIVNGDVYAVTQADLDKISGTTCVRGNLGIGARRCTDINGNKGITSLEPLSKLEFVMGMLTLGSEGVTSVAALANLRRGGLEICSNAGVQEVDLPAFEGPSLAIQGPVVTGLNLPAFRRGSVSFENTAFTSLTLDTLAIADNVFLKHDTRLRHLRFPRLVEVTNLRIEEAPLLKSLELPVISEAGNVVLSRLGAQDHALSMTGLDRLRHVRGDFQVDGLEGVSELVASSMTMVDGHVLIHGPGRLRSIRFPLLARAKDIELSSLDGLENVDLSALEVTESLAVNSASLARLELPMLGPDVKLLQAYGPLKELHAPRLQVVSNLRIVNTKLQDLGGLDAVRSLGDVMIINNSLLTQARFAALQTVTGGLVSSRSVSGNTPAVDAALLERLGKLPTRPPEPVAVPLENQRQPDGAPPPPKRQTVESAHVPYGNCRLMEPIPTCPPPVHTQSPGLPRSNVFECVTVDGVQEGPYAAWWSMDCIQEGETTRMTETMTFAQAERELPAGIIPLRETGTYENGKKHGVWRTWWYNGQPRAQETFEHGVAAGWYQSFWPDGSVRQVGQMKDGHRIGIWFLNDGTSKYEDHGPGTP